MTGRRRGSWSATGVIPSKKCSSTLRAAACAIPCSERGRHEARHRIRDLKLRDFTLRDFLAPDRRHDRALLVPLALIVAAAPRTRLLSRGTNADVGLPSALSQPECRIF